MDKDIISTFKFLNYKMKKISYIQNEKFMQDKPIQVTFDVDVQIGVDEQQNIANVILDAVVFDNAEENNYPFSANVIIEGLFKFEGELNNAEVINLCKINGTAALFPYLRASITDVTRIANEPPIVLPLINIYKLIDMKEKQMKEQDK